MSDCGLESGDGPVLSVTIDEAGSIRPPPPNAPVGLELEQAAGAKLTASWRYSPIDEQASAAGFRVYLDSGSGFDFDNPTATIAADQGGAGGEYEWSSGTLTGGKRYRVCVRSYSSAGGESQNSDSASAVAVSQGPPALSGALATWEEV